MNHLPDISPAANSKREIAEFFARAVTLICSCMPRELRIERGRVHCASCHAVAGRGSR